MKSRSDWNDLPDKLDEPNDAAARQETSFPDPWDGEHAIEYWVWSGDQLIPATPSQQAEIQETERIASARRRLTRWHNKLGQQQRMPVRVRIVRGLRQAITGAWQLTRHVTRSAASPLEAHSATAPAQHQRDER